MSSLLLFSFTVLLLACNNYLLGVNSMECSTDTGSGNVVCHDDGGRRRRLINSEVKTAAAHGRSLQSHDCPLCEDGFDWTCGDTLIQCGEQNDGGVFDGCYCDEDLDGNAVCWQDEFCALVTPCTSNDDCSNGYKCSSTCCGSGHCLAPCSDIEGAQYDNVFKEDCCDLNLPEPCDNDPCECDEDGMDLCHICHDNVGCSQCKHVGTNWKLDYNYPCVSCDSVFEGCLFCQDFNGCGQCDEANYYVRVFDEGCGVWKCQDCRELYGEGCRICQQSQCGQCWDGYSLELNEDGVQVCV